MLCTQVTVLLTFSPDCLEAWSRGAGGLGSDHTSLRVLVVVDLMLWHSFRN